jgi:hypothetical protein
LTDDRDVFGSTGPAAGRSTAAAEAGAAEAGTAVAAAAGLGGNTAGEGDGGRTEVAGVDEADRKQFWQRFLVAGLPGKPQLLAQSVISGACSSVGSSTFLSR